MISRSGTGGWTLQDNLNCSNILLSTGTLVDNGKTATVAGNILIDNINCYFFSDLLKRGYIHYQIIFF
ncbi:MAG: hypothetical protein HGB12_11585 [Bacteroidetes bacterium]|nr:hypothetical protein [Bacteroidota bacterium]